MLRRGEGGFTLLEVVVALAVLGIAAGAVAGVYSAVTGASRTTERSALLTEAARSKLIELEAGIRSTGALAETSGDLGDGLRGWTWEAETDEPALTAASGLLRLTVRIGEGSGGVGSAKDQRVSDGEGARSYSVLVRPGKASVEAGGPAR